MTKGNNLEAESEYIDSLKRTKLCLDQKISLGATRCSLTKGQFTILKEMFAEGYKLKINNYQDSGEERYSVSITLKNKN